MKKSVLKSLLCLNVFNARCFKHVHRINVSSKTFKSYLIPPVFSRVFIITASSKKRDLCGVKSGFSREQNILSHAKGIPSGYRPQQLSKVSSGRTRILQNYQPYWRLKNVCFTLRMNNGHATKSILQTTRNGKIEFLLPITSLFTFKQIYRMPKMNGPTV